MLKAYVDLMSQPARALYMFLKLSKIPHSVQQVAIRKGEHQSEEYTAVNPFQQIPAIDDDGFKLNESVAILQYLCNKYQVDDSLYPKDLQKRAKIDAFNNWQHLNLRFGGAGVFMSLVLLPLLTGKPVNQERLQLSLKSLKSSLDKMENIFLKDTPFIYSENLTIADILGICEVMQPALGVGVDVTSGFPKVEAWLERTKNSIGPGLFSEAHTYLAQAGRRFQKMDTPVPKL